MVALGEEPPDPLVVLLGTCHEPGALRGEGVDPVEVGERRASRRLVRIAADALDPDAVALRLVDVLAVLALEARAQLVLGRAEVDQARPWRLDLGGRTPRSLEERAPQAALCGCLGVDLERRDPLRTTERAKGRHRRRPDLRIVEAADRASRGVAEAPAERRHAAHQHLGTGQRRLRRVWPDGRSGSAPSRTRRAAPPTPTAAGSSGTRRPRRTRSRRPGRGRGRRAAQPRG